MEEQSRRGRYPIQGLIGLLLVAVWWPLAWLRLDPVSSYSFFPLWLGFVLTIDGLVEWRTRTSLLSRSPRKFVALFIVSAIFWWFFELVNKALGNWHYLEPQRRSELVSIVTASLAFSTVIPAVLEMAELFASFRIGSWLPRPGRWTPTRRHLIIMEVLGWLSLALVALFPRYCYPLAWTSLFFILEPINVALGQRSVGWFAVRGRWPAVWNLVLGSLGTGFFWEMWNFYSMPKWYYSIPYVGFWHVFEMPILGYLGYIPFGLEVFSTFALAFWLVGWRPQHYARIEAHTDRDSQPRGVTAPSGRPARGSQASASPLRLPVRSPDS